MGPIHKFLFAFSAFLFLVFKCYSQNNQTPSFITDSIDSYIENALADWNLPGIAVGIVKDGKIVLEKGYGISDTETNNQVDANTLFMIGSNTKAFVGTSMALLEYDKKCKLTDAVVKYVPKFKIYDNTLTPKVNLTDILTHRLGFETFQGDFMYFDSDLTDNEMFETLAKVKPMYDFRTNYGYCNAGYFVAGKCIESISGKNWRNYLQEKILTPLNMRRTFTKVTHLQMTQNTCKGHTIYKNNLLKIPYGGLDLLGPAAAMSSCVHDMNKWTTMLLDSGRFEGKQIIPQKVIDRTRQPKTIIGNGKQMFNKSNFELYGLGWELKDYEKYKIVSHTGGVDGFLSSVTLIPEINLGVIVLTNTDQNWFFMALNSEIVDAYLNLPFRNYSKEYLNIFKENQQEDSLELAAKLDSAAMHIMPDIEMGSFAGTYKNEMYGSTTLAANEGYLEMTFEHHPKLKAKLEYIGNNRFLCTYSNPTQGIKVFPFTMSSTNVLGFELSVNDFLEFTTYKFTKL